MEVPGICVICKGEAKPAFSCSLCGCVVCGNCFSSEKSLCRKCSVPSRMG